MISSTTPAPAVLTDVFREATAGKRLLVLDYDGTLAYLAIDWSSVRRELARVASTHGFKSDFRPLWGEIARFRDTHGMSAVQSLFRALAQHEEIGVDGQTPRDEIIAGVRTVMRESKLEAAILSLNLHQTIETGLRQMGINTVSAIVGADDVDHWKPDPLGLNRLIEMAGVDPALVIFVGDGQNDSDTAKAAGVDFLRV